MEKNGQVVPFPQRTAPATMTRAQIIELRQEIARAQSSRKLELILDAPSPRAVVQSMHPQEFYLTIKEIGVEDASDLLPLAKTRQITFALDVDCWKKDEFQPDSLVPWLRFLGIQDEWEAAEAVLKGLDSEALILFFQPWFIIHEKEKEEPAPLVAGELVETTDRMYYVELPFDAEDPRSVMAHGALNLFQTYGFPFVHRLFESIRHSLASELQEISYQFRKARLEELGFVDYYDALSLYQSALPHNTHFAPSLENERIAALPTIYSAPASSLFFQSYERVPHERKERIHYEMMHLTNKMMAVEQVELSSSSAMKGVIQAIVKMLDLGLDVMAGREPDAGAQVLVDNHLEGVYRHGFTALAKLRRRARLLAKREELTLVSGEWSLLETPYAILLDGLKVLRPMFHTGFLNEGEGTVRAFSSVEETMQADKALDYMEFLPRLFFDLFGFSHEALSALEYDSPGHRGEVRFSTLFLTALGQFALNEKFQLEPIPASAMQGLLKSWLRQGDEHLELDPTAWEPLVTALYGLPDASEDEKRWLEILLESAGVRLLEQAGHLNLDEEIEWKYLDLFLVKKD